MTPVEALLNKNLQKRTTFVTSTDCRFEDDAEYDEDTMVIEEFYNELMKEQPLDDDPNFEDYIPYPVEMTPETIVIFTCSTDDNDDTYTEETFVAVDATCVHQYSGYVSSGCLAIADTLTGYAMEEDEYGK